MHVTLELLQLLILNPVQPCSAVLTIVINKDLLIIQGHIPLFKKKKKKRITELLKNTPLVDCIGS